MRLSNILAEAALYCWPLHSLYHDYIDHEIELKGFREPVFGQPFHMECPLVGSPLTLYHWKKYETIDMSTETNFSADVRFSDNGRIWYVDIVTAEHSGMYVCYALNGGEEKPYVDITNFFLSISGKCKSTLCHTHLCVEFFLQYL